MQMPIYFIYVCIAQWKFLKFKFVRELENWLQWLQVDEEFIFTGKRHGGGGEGRGFPWVPCLLPVPTSTPLHACFITSTH